MKVGWLADVADIHEADNALCDATAAVIVLSADRNSSPETTTGDPDDAPFLGATALTTGAAGERLALRGDTVTNGRRRGRQCGTA